MPCSPAVINGFEFVGHNLTLRVYDKDNKDSKETNDKFRQYHPRDFVLAHERLTVAFLVRVVIRVRAMCDIS